MKNNNFFSLFFSLEGRLSRKEYLFLNITIVLSIALLTILSSIINFVFFGNFWLDLEKNLYIISVIWVTILFYPIIVIDWKRIVDAGISRIWLWIIIGLSLATTILTFGIAFNDSRYLEIIDNVVLCFSSLVFIYFCVVPSKGTLMDHKNIVSVDQKVEIKGTQYYPVSPTKFIIMYVFTFGAYHIYWAYKNWKFIKLNDPKYNSISPGLRSIFLTLFYYSFLRHFFPKEKIYVLGGIFLSYFLLSLFFSAQGIYLLIGFFGVFTLLPVVNRINTINDSKNNENIQKSKSYKLNLVNYIFLPFLIFFVVGVSLVSAYIIPDVYNIKGKSLWFWQENYLIENSIIDENEEVLYFYTLGSLGIKYDGNLVTNRGVVSYEIYDSELYIARLNYSDIGYIEEEKDIQGSGLNSLYITGREEFGEAVYLYFSEGVFYKDIINHIETKTAL